MRRKYSRSLVPEYAVEEDVNPSEHIVNMADCMLVLMLGFLVALVTRYGLDLNQARPDTEDIIGIEVSMDANQDGVVDEMYEQRGIVYLDTYSGKYYYVAD